MSEDTTIESTPGPESVLVTGFPAFTARRMTARILDASPDSKVFLLAQKKFRTEATDFIKSQGEGKSKRVRLLEGDVCDMDLGLSGSEFRGLTSELTHINHLAGIYYLGVDRATAVRVNVEGTRGVLDLARECNRLQRLTHWSTATVSGKRRGIVMEDELNLGQGFHNFYEETKFAAEELAEEAKSELPVTILRPGLIVGDSVTGEIDKFDGPYYLLVLIATNTLHLRIPMPGRGAAPMHLVPIDFVIEAAHALGSIEAAAGGTYHLTDSNPFPARRVCELIAELSDTKIARRRLPGGLARALLSAPGLRQLASAPRSFLDLFDHQVFYNNKEASALLDAHGIHCPSFDSYAANLLRHVRNVQQDKSEPDEEVYDPFE